MGQIHHTIRRHRRPVAGRELRVTATRHLKVHDRRSDELQVGNYGGDFTEETRAWCESAKNSGWEVICSIPGASI